MNFKQWILAAYAILLRFYPASFRERFAQEMMQVAAAAEPAEWRLIFSDTSVGIARCWIEGTHSIAGTAQQDAYVPIGRSPISASGLVPGIVLSVLIVAGVFYASFGRPSPCHNSANSATRVVLSSQAVVGHSVVACSRAHN